MLNDRRENVRHVVNRTAKLQENPAMRNCTIRDISSTGVKLVVFYGPAEGPSSPAAKEFGNSKPASTRQRRRGSAQRNELKAQSEKYISL